AAPADVGLALFQLLLLGAALLHLELPQLRLKLFHRRGAVLVLRAVALAGDDDAGGLVGDADRRLGPVDVLATRARRAVGVDAQVSRIDLDLEVVIDFRRYEHGGERGVAAVAGVERRLAHQPVHAGLGAQPAVGILAGELHRGALAAGDFARRSLDDLGVETVLLAPAQIHSQQHFRPVLGLGAAGACLDVEEGVAGVHLAREHARELQALDVLFQLVQFLLDVGDAGGIVFLGEQLQQFLGVIQGAAQLVEGADGFAQPGALAAQFLGALGIVPDIGNFQLAGYFLEAVFLFSVVKDTPSEPRNGS